MEMTRAPPAFHTLLLGPFVFRLVLLSTVYTSCLPSTPLSLLLRLMLCKGYRAVWYIV